MSEDATVTTETRGPIYLAGPMTGIEGFNYPAFHEAAARWRTAGWAVINPAEHFGGSTDLPRATYLRADVMVLVTDAQAIAFLPGWRGSKGATLEHAIAAELGLPMYDAGTMAPLAEETVLEEANRLIYGDRQVSYGHPIEDFTRTAAMWTAMLGDRLGMALGPADVALMMILLKVSRECHRPKKDNAVDIAGYAGTLAMVRERQAAA